MELSKRRKKIDKIDSKLLRLISQRILVVKEIGKIKELKNLPIKDPKREKERINRLSEEGRALGLTSEMIGKIWRTLFQISYKIEKIDE